MIAAALRRRGFTVVVIEQDPRVARRLQAEGVPALLGSADNLRLLERANVAAARVLVVALPDALTTRLVVEHARRLNPRLAIVARTHSEAERAHLDRLGVGEAVLGERELALEMTRYTLHRYGVSALEVQAIVGGLRARAGARAPRPAWRTDE